MSTQTTTETAAQGADEIEFIIAGSYLGASYTLWDVAPCPTDPAKRAVALEELGVEAYDAFGTVTTMFATSAHAAVDRLLAELRERSGIDDYALSADSNMDAYGPAPKPQPASEPDADESQPEPYGWAQVLSATRTTGYQVCASSLPGMPLLTFDGLPGWHHPIETRDRVRAGVLNSGLAWPLANVQVKLVPAGTDGDREGSTGLDLAIACTALAAAGHISPKSLAGIALVGELGLDGAVRVPRDLPALLRTVAENGGTTALIPTEAADTAAPGVRLIGATNLNEALAVLTGHWHHADDCVHCADKGAPHQSCTYPAPCPDCRAEGIAPAGL